MPVQPCPTDGDPPPEERFRISLRLPRRKPSLKEFETLKKIAEREKYAEGAQSEFDALLKKISPDKNEDLKRFKEEITWFLENEIISRYYYEDGRIEMSLVNDPFIIEAKKILDDKEKYDAILKGTAK
jgi:carboxyl-terminal processing protease